MTDPTEVEGFEVPLHLSLTQPILIMGAPRALAILNLTFSAALTLGLHRWLLGVFLGVTVHTAAAAFTQRDPLWFEVLRRHLRHRQVLE